MLSVECPNCGAVILVDEFTGEILARCSVCFVPYIFDGVKSWLLAVSSLEYIGGEKIHEYDE